MEAGVALSGVRVFANDRPRCRERCGVFALSGAGVKTCGVREERGTDSKKRWAGLKRNGMCVRIGSCLLPTLGEFSSIRNP